MKHSPEKDCSMVPRLPVLKWQNTSIFPASVVEGLEMLNFFIEFFANT